MSQSQSPDKDRILNSSAKNGTVGFRIIGAVKLVTALVLAAAGIGAFRLLNSDLGEFLQHWGSRLHLDPENRFVHSIISKVAGIDRAQRIVIIAGATFYAVLEFVEGVGLLLRRHWAEYLTIVATAVLLVPEIYELTEQVNHMRVTVLLGNLVILFYLIFKVGQQAKARREQRVAPEPAA